MAARTIESRRDRLVTIMVTPFMSCSARLPIYVLVIAAVFSATPKLGGVISVGGLVMAAMYLTGFIAGLGTAFLLKRTALKAPPPPFIMELPSYKVPSAKAVTRLVLERCSVFVRQTGMVIVALSVILWALLTFPAQNESSDAARLEHSFGGKLGHAIEPVITPLGFDWRIGIGLIASFAAREVLVSTLGQVYALGADVEPDSPALRDALLADIDPQTAKPRFTPLVGVSLMVFFVLAMQCLSTVATVKRETNSWRWPIAQIVYMNSLAYLASLLVYQGGRALGF
jgi:ferrous iron transport protein B